MQDERETKGFSGLSSLVSNVDEAGAEETSLPTPGKDTASKQNQTQQHSRPDNSEPMSTVTQAENEQPIPESRAKGIVSPDYTAARAWPRFFARTLDLWLESLIVVFLILVIYIAFPTIRSYLQLPSNNIGRGLIILPLAFLVDSGIYAIFKNTAGKSLLGLHVTDIRGNPLNAYTYLLRNFRVWFSGTWIGLPLISLIGMGLQGMRIDKGKPATYDEARGHRVYAAPIGFLRKAAFAGVFIGFVAIFITAANFDGLNQEPPSTIASNPTNNIRKPAPSLNYWTNPETNRRAIVPEDWNIKSSKNSSGDTVWEFIHNSGRAVIFLAAQQAPGMSLSDYVAGYRENLTNTMHFYGHGKFQSTGNHQRWRVEGTMIKAPDNIMHIQVDKKGATYWRIVIFQEVPVKDTNHDVAELAEKLWETEQ